MKRCSICKSMKEFSEFNKHSGKSDGFQSACRACNKERSRAYYKRNKKKHRKDISTRRKSRQVENRQFVLQVKDLNPCNICGETAHCCLDFHHLGNKDASVSAAVHRGWSRERMQVEILKCSVLCANCHRKVHEGLLELPRRKIKLPS